MNLNVKTPFFLTKALAAPLRTAATAEKPAKVINIASIDGIFVNPMETYSYAASKSGLIHLTRRMAVRLIRDHIVVSAIAPGPFRSDMNKAARDNADDAGMPAAAGQHKRRIVLGIEVLLHLLVRRQINTAFQAVTAAVQFVQIFGQCLRAVRHASRE